MLTEDCWSASKRNDNNGSEVKANYKSNNGLKPKMAGKVFAMSRSEVATSNDFIQGKCIIRNRLVDVIYDSGATHSFISFDCVKSLDFPVSSLHYEVVVSTLTDKLITTSSACLDCSMMVNNKTFYVNLIYLPFSHLHVVLGMDWYHPTTFFSIVKTNTLIFYTCA